MPLRTSCAKRPELMTGCFGFLYLETHRNSVWSLGVTFLSNHILIVNEYVRIWGSGLGELARHLIFWVKLVITARLCLLKASHGPCCCQPPTLSAGTKSFKLQQLIGWKRKCILLMEGEINALIFFLHLPRQNKNTDEGYDAEKQINSASQSQEWPFQWKSKMF